MISRVLKQISKVQRNNNKSLKYKACISKFKCKNFSIITGIISIIIAIIKVVFLIKKKLSIEMMEEEILNKLCLRKKTSLKLMLTINNNNYYKIKYIANIFFLIVEKISTNHLHGFLLF